MFDTHCHLSEFTRQPEIIQAAFDVDISKIITVSANVSDWQKNANIANQYPQNIIPAFGIHPLFIKDMSDDVWNNLFYYVNNISGCLIGEIGLDFYNKPTNEQKQQQIATFEIQINIAKQMNKPIIIHQRKAFNQCITLLKQQKFSNGGFAHEFSGNIEQAKQWLDLGFKLGIGTTLLKENAKIRQVLPLLPNDAWVLESDSPFRLPANSPNILIKLIQTAATILKKDIQEIANTTHNNAIKIIQLI